GAQRIHRRRLCQRGVIAHEVAECECPESSAARKQHLPARKYRCHTATWRQVCHAHDAAHYTRYARDQNEKVRWSHPCNATFGQGHAAKYVGRLAVMGNLKVN